MNKIDLTPRQTEIMQLASKGETFDGIAAKLDISIDTVKMQMVLIKRRISAHNTAHAVALSISSGLIAPLS